MIGERLDAARHVRTVILGVHHDQNRHVARMGTGPGADEITAGETMREVRIRKPFGECDGALLPGNDSYITG